VSRQRAVRRAARQAASADAAAERAARAARTARRGALTTRLAAFRRVVDLRAGAPRRRASAGPFAARRRRKAGLVALGFVVVQALVWAATPDWSIRVAVVVVSLFALPVLVVLLP